eukprot:GHUV01040827.1.p2 GENE.GHUV01040827.1~~GHUV01040827.1.p2  ORF type:complete len:105 (+),score=25.70 GHUV01040827.1:908-1222(+)
MAHTVVASRDGAVYSFGWNSNGQLGLMQREQQQQLRSSLLPSLVEDPALEDEHITQVGMQQQQQVACEEHLTLLVLGVLGVTEHLTGSTHGPTRTLVSSTICKC